MKAVPYLWHSVTICVSVLCVCGRARLFVHLCLWNICEALLLVESETRKAAAASLSLDRDLESLGTVLDSRDQAGEVLG